MTALCVLLGAFPVYASATTAPVLTVVDTPDVFITEFQTNGGSAFQEFIELYNATDHDIRLDDGVTPEGAEWKIQFFNSTSVKSGSPTWTTTATASNSIALSGVISAHDYFVLSSTGYEPGDASPDQFYEPASSHQMTDTGGGLQLLSSTGSLTEASSVHDRVMWLDPAANPVMPSGVLSKPGTGRSQQRLPNDDDEYVNVDGTLTAFAPKDDITPLAAWLPPAPIPTPETESTPAETSTDDPEADIVEDSSATTTLSPDDVADNADTVTPMITELLPNPASPQTDAADEYIEVYNPNSTAFDLKGYGLEVGTTTLHKFTFTDSLVVPAMSYMAFYSDDTHLSLANAGGQTRLRGLDGSVVSETTAYDTADADASWSLADGVWQWSTTPTPGAFNLITTTQEPTAAKAAAAAAAAAKAPAKAAVAKKATAKAATAKAKGTTTTKKAAAKTSTTKKAKAAKPAKISTTASVKPKPPIHPGILVAVAISAVLYGLYEYRHDISNKFAQLRENRAARRAGRGQTAWRRGYSPE